jgi:iron complex outermembrane recepter protein
MSFKSLAAPSLIASVALAQPIALFAQDRTDRLMLEEVVVSAQRRSENIQDVPIAITAQTAEELRRAGVVDIRDLGNVVPGLTFAGQGGIAVPTIRGVQSRLGQAGNEQPVAIYIDGVYQSNQTVNLMDLADITRLEVLKGPQGTLFGRNTTGGAITIETLKPQYETTGAIGVDYGHYTGSDQNSGEQSLKGYISGPVIDDVLAYSLSGYYKKLDGFLTNDVTGGRSGKVEKYILRGKLLWEPTDSLSIQLIATTSSRDDYQAFATQSLDGNGTSAFYPDGITSTEPWHVATELRYGSNPLFVDQDTFSIKIDYLLGELGTLTSLTAYTDNKPEFTVDLDTGTSALCKQTFVCLDFYQDSPSDNIQQEFLFTSEQFGNFSFVAGAYYFDDTSTFYANIGPVLRNGYAVRDQSTIGFIQYSDIHTTSWALFGEAMYDVTDRMRLIAGIRYSDEKKYGRGSVVSRFPTTGDVEDDAWTPKLSVVYDLTENANVYATYTEGFKSAVLSSIEQTDAFTESEKISTFEVGMKSSGPRYRFNAAAFYYDYSDLQSQVWDGFGTILSNADDATMYGFEVDGVYNVTESFQIRATAAYLHSEYGEFIGTAFDLPNSQGGMPANNFVDLEGDQMIIAPEWTASLGFTYNVQTRFGEVEASSNYHYSDELWWDYLARVKQGSYATVSAAVSLIPLTNDRLMLTLYGRNLSNEEYFTSSLLGPTADAPVYGAPRQFGFALDYAF